MSEFLPDLTAEEPKQEKPQAPESKLTPREERVARMKEKYAKLESVPKFTEWLMSSTSSNIAYLRGRAEYEGTDEEKLKEKAAAIAAIEEMNRNAQFKRMQALNADVGKLNQPFCKYCLNKGYTVSLREMELICHPCVCQAGKKSAKKRKDDKNANSTGKGNNNNSE